MYRDKSHILLKNVKQFVEFIISYILVIEKWEKINNHDCVIRMLSKYLKINQQNARVLYIEQTHVLILRWIANYNGASHAYVRAILNPTEYKFTNIENNGEEE